MKLGRSLLVVSLATLAAVGANDDAGAQPGGGAGNGKWTNGKDLLTDFTYEFAASPGFSVQVHEAAGGPAGGQIFLSFTGPGTLSSPQVSPPYTGLVHVMFAPDGWMTGLMPLCVQLAAGHAALPAGSPRRFRVRVQTPVNTLFTSGTMSDPNFPGGFRSTNLTAVTCTEQ